MIDEVEHPGGGEMEVLEDEDHGRGGREPFEKVRQAPKRSAGRRTHAQQRESAGAIHRRSSGSGTCSLSMAAIFARVVGLVVRLEQAGPPADHLAEGPEGDPFPVRGERPLWYQTRSPIPSRNFSSSQARRLLPIPAGRAGDQAWRSWPVVARGGP